MREKKVKGVILAAGYGSRFLPATKTLPKELFPLVDRPAIDFIVSEMVDAGIEDILIITSRRKKSLEDYFDREIELENALANSPAKLAKIQAPKANIHFVRQQEMKGTGDALSLCKTFAGDDAIVVAYPDDLVFGTKSLSKQLIDVYNDTNKSVLAVKDMPNEDVSRYGVVSASEQIGDNTYRVNSLVEKPAKGTEPSTMVSIGRYLFTPDIFPVIDELIDLPREGEFYQTDVINELAQEGKVAALDFEGTRYDTGEPVGYLKTLIDYALTDSNYKNEVAEFLKEKAQELNSQDSGSINKIKIQSASNYRVKKPETSEIAS